MDSQRYETVGRGVLTGLSIIILLVVLAVSSCRDDPTKPETGSIAVSVRADGSGVAGVTVSLQGPASMTATTDSNGITTFQALGAGTYTVSISGFPGDHHFPDTSGSATLESGGSASVSFQGNRLEITTASLPRGMVGAEYSAQLEAAGGTGSYAWSLASGSLPAGLSLGSDGTISGTPTTADSIACTFRVTSGGAEASRGLSVTVRRAAGTIEGVVFFDRDHDGMPSAGEGLAQLAVAFLPEDATEDGDTVSTGPDGVYSVALAPGSYAVAFPSLPDSLRASTAPTIQVPLGDTVTLHLGLVVVQEIDDFILSVSTLVLDSASASSIQISQDGATITVPTSTEGVSSLLPGDILVAGVTEATPVGLLRKVESVSTAGGQTTLSTLQATLEEAIFEGSFSVRQQLSPSDLVDFQAPEGVTLVEGAPALEFFVKLEHVVFDADGNHDTKDDQIRLDGEIRFVPTVILEGDFRRLRLRSAKAGMELDLDSDVELTWAHRAEKSLELRVARFSFAPVFFGPFLFFPSIDVLIGVEGGVEASLRANLEYSASTVAAVELRDGAWNGISSWDDEVFGGLNASLNASASAYTRVPLRLDFYGLAGPYAGVRTYVQGIVDPSADPWWELFFGTTGQAEFEMGLFSWLWSGVDMELFDLRKLILDAGGPFNLPLVTIASPEEGASFSQGEPIVFEGSAVTPGGVPLTGDALQWISDQDGELGTGGTLTRSDLSVGAHVITLEATDAFGAVGSTSVEVRVTDPSLNLTGFWEGTWTSARGGQGSVRVLVEHEGSALSGEASLAGSPCFPLGSVSGTLDEGEIVFGVLSGEDQAQFFSADFSSEHVTGIYAVPSGACAGDSGEFALHKVDVPPVSLTGFWEGTARNVMGAVGTARVILQHDGSMVSGEASISGSPCFSSGTVSGAVDPIKVVLNLVSGGDQARFLSVDFSSDHVTGTYSVPYGACAGDYGEFTVQKVENLLGVGFGPEQFALIRSGQFRMGDMTGSGGSTERPVHTVNITKAFYMQKTEVTQGQWRQVMGSNPSYFSTCGDSCPVERVSWEDIQAFLAALNAMDPGKNYRLPTEAEWEYTARAGTTGDYGGTGVLDEMGWYYDNSAVHGVRQTHPVAQKQPNHWDLYDMHGNVWEWVQDWYSGTYYQYKVDHGIVNDPPGPETGSYRVLRGGSWYYVASNARSAYRAYSSPGGRRTYSGFRLARTQ